MVKGYSQAEGIDYKKTFSQIARFYTVRIMWSVAVRENLKLSQFDITTAFLYGNLEENIFIKQPEGFDDVTLRVCKWEKSLFELKQAPRFWTERFSNFGKNFGFQSSSADSCFYIYKRDKFKMFLSIYVDDGLLAAIHECLINDFFCELNKEFNTTTTMNVKTFLGLE